MANSHSDLPYVQAGSGLERANPVLVIDMVNLTNKSGVVENDNEVVTLFEAGDETIARRFIVNIDPVATLWINLFGEDPEIGEPGNVPIVPGAGANFITRGVIKMISDTSGAKFTAGEG